MERITQLLVAAVGDVTDLTVLQQLQRKLRKQIRVVGAANGQTNNASPTNGAVHTAPKASTPAPVVQSPPATNGASHPDATGTNGTDLSLLYTVGQRIVFGTSHGEHTSAEITKVNRKRLQVQLLEPRGRKKPVPVGTVVDVDPHIFEVQAA